MRVHPFAVVGILVALLGVVSVSRADISRTIAFQGALAKPTGAPQPDGTYNVTFRLYDSATGGNLAWTELNKPVTVSGGKGLFGTSLGTPTAFGPLPFSVPYFVEVQIQGESTPMSPRIPLQAVPYAFSTGAANLSLPFSGSASVVGPAAALTVTNSGNGTGIWGQGGAGVGILGKSSSWIGVYGESATNTAVWGHGISGYGVYGDSAGAGIGVFGESAAFEGVRGVSHNIAHGGVVGVNTAGGDGVLGTSDNWQGVEGQSINSTGVAGYSTSWVGTYGFSSTNNGVWGRSTNGNGIYGLADNTGIGVYGESASFEGVRGLSHNVNHAGVVGVNSTNGTGVYGISTGGGYAGYFDGRCRVASLEIAGGADVAERFKITESAVVGAVVAIDTKHPGNLCVACGAYNHTVAGILSGAGKLDAGVILSAPGSTGEMAVAMSGRAWTLCDASYGAISPGDLLTTSETPGYAMKVSDFSRVPGATVGKAMTALESGKGLVLVLVNLQ